MLSPRSRSGFFLPENISASKGTSSLIESFPPLEGCVYGLHNPPKSTKRGNVKIIAKDSQLPQLMLCKKLHKIYYMDLIYIWHIYHKFTYPYLSINMHFHCEGEQTMVFRTEAVSPLLAPRQRPTHVRSSSYDRWEAIDLFDCMVGPDLDTRRVSYAPRRIDRKQKNNQQSTWPTSPIQ